MVCFFQDVPWRVTQNDIAFIFFDAILTLFHQTEDIFVCIKTISYES